MMKLLFKPIDAAILIYFRFFSGVLLSIELINSLKLGDFQEYSAPFHFSYLYFDWIKPLPAWGLSIHYALTISAGFSFAVGYRQRFSAVILCLGYTLLFLMEKSEYINHLYLYCLISFWLIWMPEKKFNRMKAPAWYFYILLFHISIVYFFAGLAKLNPDWLSGNAVTAMLGKESDWKYFFAWGGMLFDLLIVPLLIWPRSRKIAFVMASLFHLSNVYNFGLATFPWFSLMMTALFFGSSWPRKFSWFDDFYPEISESATPRKGLATILAVYCLLHLLIPLRHHLYPGNPSWTEDGHQFSWRMKLRNKTGDVVFFVVDRKSRMIQTIFPQSYLTKKQYRDMIGKPDSILQFAHYLKNQFGDVAIHASSRISVNGLAVKEMINVNVDLSREPRKLGSYHWILNHDYFEQIKVAAP